MRVTVSIRLAVPSVTAAVATVNCTVFSLSTMVLTVDIGETSVAPVAPESVTVKVRFGLGAPSSAMVTGIGFGPVSPSFHCSEPFTPV